MPNETPFLARTSLPTDGMHRLSPDSAILSASAEALPVGLCVYEFALGPASTSITVTVPATLGIRFFDAHVVATAAGTAGTASTLSVYTGSAATNANRVWGSTADASAHSFSFAVTTTDGTIVGVGGGASGNITPTTQVNDEHFNVAGGTTFFVDWIRGGANAAACLLRIFVLPTAP